MEFGLRIAKNMTSRGLVLGSMVGIGLFVIGCCVDWQRLPINGLNRTLNDQVGYISVARHWLDDGRLDSSLIYPSVLQQRFSRNSLYMPGYYAELALTFRMLGYSAMTARLPAIASFLLACGLVYWIARRLFGQEASIYGLALFAFSPKSSVRIHGNGRDVCGSGRPNCIFIILVVREKFRWWAGPVALTLPILFRETGVALGVVMSVMVFFSATEARKRKAILCGLLVCVVLVAIILSPAGAGRPSLWRANILAHGRFDAVFSDAFALQQVPSSGPDWMAAVGRKFISNLVSLIAWPAFAGPLEGVTVLFLLSGIPLGVWMWRQKRDAFALGVALAVSLLLITDLCVYAVWNHRGIHALLLMEPFVAILWGVTITLWTREIGGRLYTICSSQCVLSWVWVLRCLFGKHRRTTHCRQKKTLHSWSL